MFDDSIISTRTRSLDGEGPGMQAFLGRHGSFFILLAVMVGQLLLLSLQITRNHNARLIQVWAVAVFDPFERSLHWAVSSARNTGYRVRSLWHAEQDNLELHRQLDTLQMHEAQLAERAAEADRLRALLALQQSAPFETLAADVIAASPGERVNAVFINKGEAAGLARDMGVMTPEGVVGKIVEVFPFTAQVLLLTDPTSGVGCLLEATRAQGVLKGTGQGSGDLRYILKEEPVSVGERVLTSGLDQIYPPGLPVGTVTRIEDGSVYKKITVRPAAALDRLENVLVILRPKSSGENVPSKPAQH